MIFPPTCIALPANQGNNGGVLSQMPPEIA